MAGKDHPERPLRVYHYEPVDAADRFPPLEASSSCDSWPTPSSGVATVTAPSFWKRSPRFPAWLAARSLTQVLRRFEDDRGWIKTLFDEAQNERAHLMTFPHLAKPTSSECSL